MKSYNTILNLSIILIVFSSYIGMSSIDNDKTLKQDLFGMWEFEELRDKKGNKVDTIWHPVVDGYEIPNGPTITFRDDGSYSKQFTSKNTDNGKWIYDNKKNEIIFYLYYKKPHSTTAQYLINSGHAQKDQNGDYFEILTNKVDKLTDETLILIEDEKRRRSFKKRVIQMGTN